jgi:hypothetical protein
MLDELNSHSRHFCPCTSARHSGHRGPASVDWSRVRVWQRCKLMLRQDGWTLPKIPIVLLLLSRQHLLAASWQRTAPHVLRFAILTNGVIKRSDSRLSVFCSATNGPSRTRRPAHANFRQFPTFNLADPAPLAWPRSTSRSAAFAWREPIPMRPPQAGEPATFPLWRKSMRSHRNPTISGTHVR